MRGQPRGKQSAKKGFGTQEAKQDRKNKTKRGERGGTLPIGLIASAAPPFLSEISKPSQKEDDETKYISKTTYEAREFPYQTKHGSYQGTRG